MTLLEIPSLEEGTSKEKEGWRIAALVVIVEAAVQILAACTFVQGRTAARLVMGSLPGMHKGTDCECCTPSKNSQTRGNLAGTNSRWFSLTKHKKSLIGYSQNLKR